MKKGKPFLEILASMAHEDFRFPQLEIFAFLFVFATFALANLVNTSRITSGEVIAYFLIASAVGTPLLIFLLLILKNIAYGFGGDIEKGIVQTYLSYPLRRKSILTARVLSSIGIPTLLFFGAQLVALSIRAPSLIMPQSSIVLLTFAASFGEALLLTSIILIIALVIKKGMASLVISVVLFGATQLAVMVALFLAPQMGLTTLFPIVSVLNPSFALQAHYGIPATNTAGWRPPLTEVTYYVMGNYAITAAVFFVCYVYFSRRLSA